jgi:hypothetical protein
MSLNRFLPSGSGVPQGRYHVDWISGTWLVTILEVKKRHFADLCEICSMSIDDFRSIWIINTIKIWSEANKRACRLTVSARQTGKNPEKLTIFLM